MSLERVGPVVEAKTSKIAEIAKSRAALRNRALVPSHAQKSLLSTTQPLQWALPATGIEPLHRMVAPRWLRRVSQQTTAGAPSSHCFQRSLAFMLDWMGRPSSPMDFFRPRTDHRQNSDPPERNPNLSGFPKSSRITMAIGATARISLVAVVLICVLVAASWWTVKAPTRREKGPRIISQFFMPPPEFTMGAASLLRITLHFVERSLQAGGDLSHAPPSASFRTHHAYIPPPGLF
ncbi:hypothetical protein C8R44DRAFT_884863 [Mycena epipterygia]|nr:hypothetical protein C8R44DRAFT_884863 [Mycena epipterygia]